MGVKVFLFLFVCCCFFLMNCGISSVFEPRINAYAVSGRLKAKKGLKVLFTTNYGISKKTNKQTNTKYPKYVLVDDLTL